MGPLRLPAARWRATLLPMAFAPGRLPSLRLDRASGAADDPPVERVLGDVPRAGFRWLFDTQPWRFAAVLVIVFSVLFIVVGSLASQLGPREPMAGSWEELVYSGPLASLVSFWQRWDALWYQHIATSGYAPNDGSIAFFPLYPFASRLVSVVLAGNILLAELVVSAIACVGALAMLWRLVNLEIAGGIPRRWILPYPVTFDRKVAIAALTVLLTLCFPVGFFLLAPFTESLFLLFAVATLYFARSGRPWLAGLAGLAASLARTQGVFLVLPIAWEVVRARDGWDWIRRRGGRPPGWSILAAALPLGGIVAFTLFQRVVLGGQKSGFELQAIWGYQLVLPTDAFAAAWGYVTSDRGVAARAVEAFNAISLVGATLITLLAARRLPFAYTLYVLPSLLVLYGREMYFSPLMSVSRYVLVLFPCFMVAAAWLAPHPRIAAAVLFVGVGLELALFQYWVRWGFVA